MALNVGREMARLKRMTPKQLRERYAEVFGEATRSGNKQFMIKAGRSYTPDRSDATASRSHFA